MHEDSPECGSELEEPEGVKEPGSSGRKNVGHGLNGIRTPRWAGAGSGRQL